MTFGFEPATLYPSSQSGTYDPSAMATPCRGLMVMASGWRSEGRRFESTMRITLTPLATFDPGLPQNAQKK